MGIRRDGALLPWGSIRIFVDGNIFACYDELLRGAVEQCIHRQFRRPLNQLDHGMELEINREDEAVWAFEMTLLGDMPEVCFY